MSYGTTRCLPDTVYIARGSHAPGDPTTGDPACTMEWVAWLAGEPWGDDPACTHPVIAAAVRAVNDRLDDGPRQQLAELIPALVGTADTRDDSLARRRLSVRLAAWCAERVLHMVPDVAREACERAIVAARAWADADASHAADAAVCAAEAAAAAICAADAVEAAIYADAASHATDAAIYAADAAIWAASHAADATIWSAEAADVSSYATEAGHAAATAAAIDADGDPIGLLRGLLAEHARLRQEAVAS